jgi:hypothetical protein
LRHRLSTLGTGHTTRATPHSATAAHRPVSTTAAAPRHNRILLLLLILYF